VLPCRLIITVFTAQRDVCSVYTVVHPSVCPSVCHKPVYRNHWTNRAVFLWRRLPFSSAYSTLCLLHVSFSQIPDLENFAAASRSRCQQNSSSSSSSTVELVDYTYTTVDKSTAILSCLRQSPLGPCGCLTKRSVLTCFRSK